ncbi:MAG: hypothetical protein QM775_27055 [Pirellulales bacterium]
MAERKRSIVRSPTDRETPMFPAPAASARRQEARKQYRNADPSTMHGFLPLDTTFEREEA